MPKPPVLSPVAIFKDLSEDALLELERTTKVQSHPEGRWIVGQDETGTDVYFVLSGTVRVMTFGTDREVIFADLPAGSVFGEMSAIDRQARSASVIASTDVTVGKMTASAFLDAIHRHPALCDAVLRLLVARVRGLDVRMHEFANYTVGQRLRAELLRLAVPSKTKPKEAEVADLTHAEIAARIGTHREAVTRELATLAKKGIIAKKVRGVTILDAVRLSATLEPDDDD